MQFGSRAVGSIGLIAVVGVAFLLAAAVAILMIGPTSDKPVGYDTAGSVLYFKRLTHHQLLEAPYGATPKPAMTVIDGLLYRLGGWGAISLAAAGVYALVATLGGVLAHRLSGARAGVFAFVALVGCRALLLDASVAYAVGWAALWLLAAGFALTGDRPRYWLAGLALCVAALTRLETIVVVAGAVGIVAASRIAGPRLGICIAPRDAWLLSLGFLAIPVMLLHDWLLTGDPLYWTTVSANFSAAYTLAVRDVSALGGWMISRYLPMAVLITLSIVGVAALFRRRSTAVGLGLLLLAPGIVAFLFLLSSRGTYVSDRYLFLVDVTLAFAGAIGFAEVRVSESSKGGRRPRLANLLAAVATVAVAMGAGGPFAPAEPSVQAQIAAQRIASANLQAAKPLLRAELAASAAKPGAMPRLVVPGLLGPVAIVDLGLRIADVGTLRFASDGTLDPRRLRDGAVIYHDARADPKNAASSQLDRGDSFTVGEFTLVPLAAHPEAGWWVYLVRRTP